MQSTESKQKKKNNLRTLHTATNSICIKIGIDVYHVNFLISAIKFLKFYKKKFLIPNFRSFQNKVPFCTVGDMHSQTIHIFKIPFQF